MSERPDDGRMIGVAFSEDTYWMRIKYRNWRGEVATRCIKPIKMFFGSNEWHPEEQWLMEAMDLDKVEVRVFAMRDMSRP